MTDTKLFGVVVRAFGLWSIFVGISAIHGIVQMFGVRTLNNFDWQPAGAFAAAYFIAGYTLLRKADTVVAFAYRAVKREGSN